LKPRLKLLRRGERIWAIVEEVQSLNQVVINFSGDLIRVSNESDRIFRVGQRVLLQVENVHPLQFKIITKTSLELSRSLDVSI
jgi:hypothetical protein